jgi:heterodisulfide reductase subunit B
MLTRFPIDIRVDDNAENPQSMEAILRASGALIQDWNYKTACCGASAAIYDPDLAALLMSRIMREAVARDVNCLVTTCPVCQMNLDVYQDRFCQQTGIQRRLPVYFLTELLGFALGFGIEALQVERHFTQATHILEELERQQSEVYL